MQDEDAPAAEAGAADLAANASSPAALLLRTGSSIFREGFYSPSLSSDLHGVPWSSVREALSMARDALKAKQRAADKLKKEVETLRKDDRLLKRAQRAEVDCGSLVDELEQLMQAKEHVAQQRSDLDRANALLMAERELLCEQLQVAPDNVNLCQAVSKVLAAAKRARGLDAQLRLLAKCQRELLLQLEAQREEAARAARQWQAREQVYQQLLAAHGIEQHQLPGLDHPAEPAAEAAAAGAAGLSAGAPADSGDPGASMASSGGAAAAVAQKMLLRMANCGAAAAQASVCGIDAGSQSHAHLLPPTPPVHELHPGSSPTVRRSHSLDSGLNSLTGLLDQLALGQLNGSEEGTDYMFDDCEQDSEPWMVDSMSADSEPFADWQQQQHTTTSSSHSCQGVMADAVPAGAGSLAPSKGLDQHVQQHAVHHMQHLQPVQEALDY